MKIKCTADNCSETHSFTIGKTYEIIKDLKGYKIINNGGTVWCNGRQSEEIVLSELRDYYGFEVVPEVTTCELHITCNDGKTTNAVYKVNGKIEKRTEAVCAPSDTFDFATGAQTAFDRVFPKSQPIAPQEDKAKFKVGNLAKVIANSHRRHYVDVGDVVKIIKMNSDFVTVIPTHEVEHWSQQQISCLDIEPYAEPEQPKSKYESMSNDELKRLACGISELCCPASSNKKRKSDCPFYHTRCEVTNENRSEIIQYLIDEDTPEPEKEPEPVYFSGKVVCTATDGDGTFTVGKVYGFVDGQVLDNKSYKRPTGMKMKSLNDGYLANWYYRFIPYLGEA